MSKTPFIQRLLLIDIDGLRRDVFERALADGAIPNIARLLGGAELANGIQFPALSTAPSITFCCQATIFTGAHPHEHWVPGNQFFDRFGRIADNVPTHYAFDIGNQLAFDDAINVFRNGLAGAMINPEVETIYETAARHGLSSTVVYNMYARGAEHWIKPGPDDWFSFFTFKEFLGISSEGYDRAMLNDALKHLRAGHRPDVLTLYFWGLDHTSHTQGPDSQYQYLTTIINRQMGEFFEEYEALGLLNGTLLALVSDHGQIRVSDEDKYALQLGFPFDRELGHFFDALGLDVHDYPGEGPDCDSLITPNGGLAHVYLQHAEGQWKDAPRFEQDVLRVAEAFWEANQSGKYCADLLNAIELILVRNVERDGWSARYQVYTPEQIYDLEDYLATHPELEMADPINRLNNLCSPVVGDILLASNYEDGYYFLSAPYKGIHGGLHPGDSESVLTFSLPTGTPEQVAQLREVTQTAIAERCARENGRQVSIADMAHGLRAVMGWL